MPFSDSPIFVCRCHATYCTWYLCASADLYFSATEMETNQNEGDIFLCVRLEDVINERKKKHCPNNEFICSFMGKGGRQQEKCRIQCNFIIFSLLFFILAEWKQKRQRNNWCLFTFETLKRTKPKRNKKSAHLKHSEYDNKHCHSEDTCGNSDRCYRCGCCCQTDRKPIACIAVNVRFAVAGGGGGSERWYIIKLLFGTDGNTSFASWRCIYTVSCEHDNCHTRNHGHDKNKAKWLFLPSEKEMTRRECGAEGGRNKTFFLLRKNYDHSLLHVTIHGANGDQDECVCFNCHILSRTRFNACSIFVVDKSRHVLVTWRCVRVRARVIICHVNCDVFVLCSSHALRWVHA